MNYDEACKEAKLGKQLFIPGWNGYFFWDYGTNSLAFKNKEYRSSGESLYSVIKNIKEFLVII